MTGLDNWLNQATRHLAKASAAQVRTEILEHYESAREAAVAEGVSADAAATRALTSLGDAKIANRQYREVLLTSSEARMLRDRNWEALACSRPYLKWLFLAVPFTLLAIAAALYLAGRHAFAQDVSIMAFGMSPLLLAPLLPIYTPFRGRIFRYVKWVAFTGAFLLILGPLALKSSWLFFACLWPLGWSEWTRASIRRKLPSSAWPKHLYL
jgi:hypothetical protein